MVRPVGRPKGTPKTGGRKKGTPNKVTASIRDAAREYGPECLDVLSEVMRDGEAPPQARVGAARELLDRGYGKPAQAVELAGKDGAPLPEVAVMSTLALRARVLALVAQLPALPGGEPSEPEP